MNNLKKQNHQRKEDGFVIVFRLQKILKKKCLRFLFTNIHKNIILKADKNKRIIR